MSRHLKREAAPVFWPIARKAKHWTVKPLPGPHPLERCIPVLILVRDFLKLAKNYREARIIIKRGEIRVDGRVVREVKFPSGLMDVIEIPKLKKFYRILPSRKGLEPREIPEEDSKFKFCRIENKTTVKGGHIQLNLHDGRNILIRVKDPRNPVEDVYHTFDSLKISLPDQEILDVVEMKEGNIAVITGGSHSSRIGRILKIEQTPPYPKVVSLADESGDTFQTVIKYVFPIARNFEDAKRLLALCK